MSTPSFALWLIPTLALAGGLATGSRAAGPAPAPSPAATATDGAGCEPVPTPRRAPIEVCREPAAPPQLRGKVFHQLRYHSQFPASRAQLISAFRSHGELTTRELAWVSDRLPAGVFASAPATLAGLFPDAPAHLLARLDPGAAVTLAGR